jgi:hypothetical protein
MGRGAGGTADQTDNRQARVRRSPVPRACAAQAVGRKRSRIEDHKRPSSNAKHRQRPG